MIVFVTTRFACSCATLCGLRVVCLRLEVCFATAFFRVVAFLRRAFFLAAISPSRSRVRGAVYPTSSRMLFARLPGHAAPPEKFELQ